MNAEHPNISILKRFDPASPRTAADLLAEDFVWHYINPKLPEMQGDYFGLAGLTDLFKRIAGHTSGSFQVNPISIAPMGDHLVITHVKDKVILEGKNTEIDAVVTWCIIDGKIKEAWDIPVSHTAKFLK
ncbi:MAG: nuclear transport factor 2 family protein [Reichenbachiella sp.]|uniref:nuclear transport factor 2 family protein n=1 Tax=Reichenbachiella sp. TaxID=2184521 RepID=UPI0032630615